VETLDNEVVPNLGFDIQARSPWNEKYMVLEMVQRRYDMEPLD
jgi:hypothetical protein